MKRKGFIRAIKRLLVSALPGDDWSREFVDELDAELEKQKSKSGGLWASLWYLCRVLSPHSLMFVWMMKRREGLRASLTTALDVRTDIAQAVRGLTRDPRAAAFIVLTLALGIASVTAMYSVAERVFLSGPEHVNEPEQLARIYLTFDGPNEARTTPWIPYLTARAVAANTRGLSGAVLYRTDDRLARVALETGSLRIQEVGDAYFGLTGVIPAAGRFFGGPFTTRSSTSSPSFNPSSGIAVLSHALAVRAFGGPSGAINRTIEVAGSTFSVGAVAPTGFSGVHIARVDIWLPIEGSNADRRNWQMVGRLPGRGDPASERGAAAAEATAVHQRTDPGRSFRWANDGTILLAELGADDTGRTPAVTAIAQLLLALVGLVLLISCANVLNLLLARMTRRSGEITLRLALGIGRWRLLRLLVSETIVLAVAGGLLSIPLAFAGSTLLRETLLPDVAWSSSPVDFDLLAMTAALAVLTGLGLGLFAVPNTRSASLAAGLTSGRLSAGKGRTRTRAVLAVIQVTLSAALLICAGLFLKSFWTIKGTDLGVQAGEAMAVQLRSLDAAALRPGSDSEQEAYRNALATLRGMAGGERSALALGLPFVTTFGTGFWVPGVDSIPELPGGGPFLSAVSGRYFEAVGTPVLRGLPITDEHVARNDRVVVVGESMAQTVWPGANPLGSCVRIGAETEPCARVIGVVADVHRQGYREPPSLQFYIPLGQERGFSGLALVVRPPANQSAFRSRLTSVLTTPETGVDYVEVTRLDALLAEQVRPWQLGAVVLTLTSLIAGLVSLLGVYGVLSYAVAQRRREIGVRMALGASTRSIRRVVLAFGLTTAGLGITSGIALVLAASRWISPLLFETSIADITVMGLVATSLGSATLVACLLPARLATQVDPVECLRSEA